MPPPRSPRRAGVFFLLVFLLVAGLVLGQSTEERKKERRERRVASRQLTDLPLPVGHEAKGIILPDYDEQGQLRARFEAGTAKRLSESDVLLRDLKMVTFTAEDAPELEIVMPEGTLNLRTRVLTSGRRTTVSRSDFQIAGDTLEFDTRARQGQMKGNVQMVIVASSNLMPETPK